MSTAARCGSTATWPSTRSCVLGELAVGQGMYGADTLHVHPRGNLEDTPAQLTEALGELVDTRA